MSQSALDRYVAALATGQGLHDEFIYSMTFDDYTAFPDPFPRTAFSVREVEARIERYPNPARSQKLFQWDIHGRLLTPAKASLQEIAVVMIHGGAVNEFEFIFTPDGPEAYLDLTKPIQPTPVLAWRSTSLRSEFRSSRSLFPDTTAGTRGHRSQNEDLSSSLGKFPGMKN